MAQQKITRPLKPVLLGGMQRGNVYAERGKERGEMQSWQVPFHTEVILALPT